MPPPAGESGTNVIALQCYPSIGVGVHDEAPTGGEEASDGALARADAADNADDRDAWGLGRGWKRGGHAEIVCARIGGRDAFQRSLKKTARESGWVWTGDSALESNGILLSRAGAP